MRDAGCACEAVKNRLGVDFFDKFQNLWDEFQLGADVFDALGGRYQQMWKRLLHWFGSMVAFESRIDADFTDFADFEISVYSRA